MVATGIRFLVRDTLRSQGVGVSGAPHSHCDHTAVSAVAHLVSRDVNDNSDLRTLVLTDAHSSVVAKWCATGVSPASIVSGENAKLETRRDYPETAEKSARRLGSDTEQVVVIGFILSFSRGPP
jgi:hypothetical protein